MKLKLTLLIDVILVHFQFITQCDGSRIVVALTLNRLHYDGVGENWRRERHICLIDTVERLPGPVYAGVSNDGTFMKCDNCNV